MIALKWRSGPITAVSFYFSATSCPLWFILRFLWIDSPLSGHLMSTRRFSATWIQKLWLPQSGYSPALWHFYSMKVSNANLEAQKQKQKEYEPDCYFSESCHFYYEEKIHFLTFTSSEFCGYIGWYGDFLKNASIVAVVVSIDMLTVFKVRNRSKKVTHHFTVFDAYLYNFRLLPTSVINLSTECLVLKWDSWNKP